MRRIFAVAMVVAPMIARAAELSAEGRWQGVIEIPGRPVHATLDVALDAAGVWQGSLTMPALGLAGAPVKEVVVSGRRVTFAFTGAFDGSRYGTARVDATLAGTTSLSGRFMQGGHSAPVVLTRVGSAQVQLAARSRPVRGALEGEWVGQYELGGYPRNVTIALDNAAGKGATATFVIVGKQKTVIPVDLVVEDGEFVRVESQEYRVVYEARIGADARELSGVVSLGGTEVPLVMRRAAGARP